MKIWATRSSFLQSTLLQNGPSYRMILAFLLLWIATPTIGASDSIYRKEDEPSSCKIAEDKHNENPWVVLDSHSQVNTIIRWLQGLEGGIVDVEKFEIVKRNPSDDSLNPEFDFLATQDISEGTVLMEIPQTVILTGDLQEETLDALKEEIPEEFHSDITACMAIEEIVNERRKGVESRFHHYLDFVFGVGNPKGRKPNGWSERAKSLFWDMIGDYFTMYTPAEEFNNFQHEVECEAFVDLTREFDPDQNNPIRRPSLETEAYTYFAKHAWGTSLIPLFDMIPHRNGRWKNIEARFVDTETNTPIQMKARESRFDILRRTDNKSSSEMKLVVYAHRDIQRGEPLRISLNQCEHLGCESLQFHYTASDILADVGVIEEYPRRWLIRSDSDDLNYFIFDVDVVDNGDGETKTVRVIKNNPTDEEYFKYAFFATSVDRWRYLEKEIMKHMKDWDIEVAKDRYEYDTIREYQRAYTEAFEHAWLHRNDGIFSDDAMESLQSKNTTQNIMEEYDDLSGPKGPALHSKGWYAPCAEGVDSGEDHRIAKTRTFYQDIEYLYSAENDNTRMKLGLWTHSSSNFRSHYHEAIIQVALQYVEHPKRVAYIGGGDNMVLAEFLKYDSIEKIVAMELDQQVCRLSMKYFGTTPAYHDERVEWWYGNGATSMQLFPEDYWGSFDLVLVDLLTDIADSIKVTADLSLSEASLLLMKPDGGVLARNDDFSDRSEVMQRLANKVVFYDHYDIPRICELSSTLVSDSVDFLRGPRYNHGIDTLARLTNFDEEAYSGWSRYFDNTNVTAFKNEDVCNKIKMSLQEKQSTTSPSGVLLVIEAENTTASLQPDDLPTLHQGIQSIAKEHGLSPLTIQYHPDQDIHSFVLLCENGYIKMQTYPQFDYVAFDLALWGNSSFVANSDIIQKHLVASVGGGMIEGSVSTFRVVTGGMNEDKDHEKSNHVVVEKALNYYCDGSSNSGNTKSSEAKLTASRDTEEYQFVDQSILFSQLLPTIAKRQDKEPLFAIFCGKKDDEVCQGYSSVATNYEDAFHPIYSCQSFDNMKDCESQITQQLLAIVSERKLFDGFILDRSVSLDMGRVLHKIFNNTLVQPTILEQSFSALAPGGEGTWKNTLLDRFRTEMIVSPPVQKADIEISNGTHREDWSMISIRKLNFLNELQSSVENIQGTTGWVITTRKILDSVKPVITDWQPSRVLTDSDFFQEEVMNQWLGQRPVANQYVLQMELDVHPASVEVGDTVLVGKQFRQDGTISDPRGFLSEYYEANIVEVKGRDMIVAQTTPYQLSDGSFTSYQQHYHNERAKAVPRHQIRKISPTEKDRRFQIGDLVLVKQRHPVTKEVIPVAWYAAYVRSIDELGVTVRQKHMDTVSDESLLVNIPRDDIILYYESPEFSIREAGISLDALQHAFRRAISRAGLAMKGFHMQPWVMENGYLLSFQSPKGSGIVTWDGAGRVDVNMQVKEGKSKKNGVHFDNEINRFWSAFSGALPGFKLVAQDSFPRGYDKVVAFQHDLVAFEENRELIGIYIPHWMKRHVPA